MPVMEVGGVARVGGRYAALLCSYWSFQGYSAGVFLFEGAAPEGPFRPADAGFAVLASRGPWSAYFARFVCDGSDLLVHHHVISRADERAFAPLKRVVQDDRGGIRLAYWAKNDALCGRPLAADPAASRVAFDPERGVVVDARVMTDRGPVELFVPCSDGGAARIVLDGSLLRIVATGSGDEERAELDPPADGETRLRLLLRGPFLEVYADGFLAGCYSLPSSSTGSIQAPLGQVAFTQAYAMSLEP